MAPTHSNSNSDRPRWLRLASLLLVAGAAAVHISIYLGLLAVPPWLCYPLLAMLVFYIVILPRLGEPKVGPRERRLRRVVDSYAYAHCLAVGAAVILSLYFPSATVLGLRPSSVKGALAVQAVLTLLVSMALRAVGAASRSGGWSDAGA